MNNKLVVNEKESVALRFVWRRDHLLLLLFPIYLSVDDFLFHALKINSLPCFPYFSLRSQASNLLKI